MKIWNTEQIASLHNGEGGDLFIYFVGEQKYKIVTIMRRKMCSFNKT